jgi:flagellar motility protein MotE (MotC chaperone)
MTTTTQLPLLVAKNVKNQSKVNKCVRALVSYNKANDERNVLENDGEEKGLNAINRKCENLFDKYLTAADELPKYELKRIESLYY